MTVTVGSTYVPPQAYTRLPLAAPMACVIVWNGFDEPTTVVSDTEVSTGVNMAVWFAPVAVPVQVRAGGNLSNSLIFRFTEATRRDDGRGHHAPGHAPEPPSRHPGPDDPHRPLHGR